LGHTAVGVEAVGGGCPAGVQDDEAERVVIADVSAELGRRYVDSASVRIAQRKYAVPGARVEVTVTDEVEHVHGVLPKPSLQFDQRRVSQPIDDDETGSFGLGECVTDTCPFMFYVEPFEIIR
jgi:hypothetical protein